MIFKIFLTVSLPFILVWTVLSRVWLECKSIPLYIRCDVGMELAYYMMKMREQPPAQERKENE